MHLASKLRDAGWIQFLSEPSLWTILTSEGNAVAALVCCVDHVLIESGDVVLADLVIANILCGGLAPCRQQTGFWEPKLLVTNM